jgi:hypothetical protein
METILLLGGAFLILIFAGIYFFKKIKRQDELLLPDLSVSIESYDDSLCGIKLTNRGKGTAVIKDINFWNGMHNGAYKKSIDQVFPFNKSYWMNNTEFCCDKDFFLASGDSLYFGKLKKERVLQRGGNYIKTKQMFDEKVKDIKIKVDYTDVFSHKISPLLYNN